MRELSRRAVMKLSPFMDEFKLVAFRADSFVLLPRTINVKSARERNLFVKFGTDYCLKSRSRLRQKRGIFLR